MACELELAPRTLAVFDEACEALDLDADDVRAGEETIEVDDEHAGALLEVLAPGADVPASHIKQAARRSAHVWFSVAMGQVHRATQQAQEQAEAVGVLEVMERHGGTGKPLQRVLATLPADEYEKLWHEWEIERALTYLMLRSIDHVSENLEDYL